MSEYDTVGLISLAGFGIIILLALIPRIRGIGFGKTVQMALAWVVIFGGLIFLAAQWPTIRSALDPSTPRVEGESVMINAREDGHFYVRGAVNDAPALFLVDTGASDVVLNLATARAAGIDPQALIFDGAAQTANGLVRIAAARAERLQIGSIVVRNQPVSVSEGDLQINLLGQRFLNELDSWRVENGRLMLVP